MYKTSKRISVLIYLENISKRMVCLSVRGPEVIGRGVYRHTEKFPRKVESVSEWVVQVKQVVLGFIVCVLTRKRCVVEGMRRLRWELVGLLVVGVCVLEWSEVTGAFTQALDSDFTFTLPPGRKECFYQTMKKDASLEIEYQVNMLLFRFLF